MLLIDQLSEAATPILSGLSRVRLIAAGPGLWRVSDRAGRVIGHLQSVRVEQSVRYRARRFQASTRAFRDLGDFWSADDAIECLVFAR